MSKWCPALARKVIYLTCMECDDKICKKKNGDDTMKKLEIYTDGSCLDNQSKNNFGGWAFVVVGEGEMLSNVEVAGGAKDTTNNQMEMTAVIKALNWLIPTDRAETIVNIYSDSAYIVNCFKDEWYVGWRKNGWKNSKNKPVENKELWEAMLALVEQYATVNFKKVAGHSGETINERCDTLCVAAANKFKTESAGQQAVAQVQQNSEKLFEAALPVYKTQGMAQAPAPVQKMLQSDNYDHDIVRINWAISEFSRCGVVFGNEGEGGQEVITGEQLAAWLKQLRTIKLVASGN